MNAFDYIVKPFTDQRFRATLDRVRRYLRRDNIQDLSVFGTHEDWEDSPEGGRSTRRTARRAVPRAAAPVFRTVARMAWRRPVASGSARANDEVTLAVGNSRSAVKSA